MANDTPSIRDGHLALRLKTAQDKLAHLAAGPDLAPIFAAYAQAGAPLFFVGGVVRDALMAPKTHGHVGANGAAHADVDLASPLLPEAAQEVLSRAGLRHVATGLSHGTISALVSGRAYQITTFRTDIETDGRHAVVQYGQDLATDAARRDFTMNALYAGPDGAIIDPLGHGVADCVAGRLAFVGDARTRIREDGLRMVRYMRFVAQLGATPDDEAIAAIADLHDLARHLSAERIWAEVQKLLAQPSALAACQLLNQTGLAQTLFGADLDVDLLAGLEAIAQNHFLPIDPIHKMLALCGNEAQKGRNWAHKLKMSNADKARLEAALTPPQPLVSYLSAREVRRLLYLMGPQAFADAVMVAWAKDSAPQREIQWRALLAMTQFYQRPVLRIGGDQILAAGASPGKPVGRVLDALTQWWIDSDFIDDELSQIERLKALVQAIGHDD